MRNLKYLFLSLGFLLIALGGINFYNQDYSPRIPILGKLYRFLHGYERTSSYWSEGKKNFNTSKLHNDYFYNLEYLDIRTNETIFHFRIKNFLENKESEAVSSETNQNTKSSTHAPQDAKAKDDPFANPVIKIIYDNGYEDIYPLTSKNVYKDELGDLIIDLFFPKVVYDSGEIHLWCEYNKYSNEQDRLYWFSPSRDYEQSGPNIWGVMLFVGIITFVIAAKINPLKSINKQIIASAAELDDAKKISLKRVSNRKTYDRLSSADKYRYDTLMDYYNNAQNIIFEGHKLYSKKSLFTFEIFFKSIIFLGVVFLFASVLMSGFNIFIPDTFKLFQTSEPRFGYHSLSFLNERLGLLENAKPLLTIILLCLLGLGILSTIATYAINIWKVREVARRFVGKRIEKLNIKMRLEIENKTEPIDTRIISLGNKLNSTESIIESSAKKTDAFIYSSKQQFSKIYNKEKKYLNKEIKKRRKQFRTNIINLFRR